jgi:peptidoglycan/LPS O-acetylase OafA/YrhL
MTTVPERPVESRLEIIDALRGFAILLVVIFHIWQLSWLDLGWALGSPLNVYYLYAHGYIGVEIFFFLSGFCIYLPYARAQAQGEAGPSLGTYAWRRLVKIVPSYALVLVAGYLLEGDRIPKDQLWLHVTTHLTFTHIWFYETFDTFGGVLWSLAVEVQFYALVPLLLPLLRRAPLPTALGMVLVASAYRAVISANHPENGVFFSHQLNQLPGFLDLFAGGIVAAILVARAKPPLSLGQRVLGTLVALAATVALFQLLRTLEPAGRIPGGIADWQTRFRGVLALVLVVVVVATERALPVWRRWIAPSPLRFLALISYNLYLWHKLLADTLMRNQIPWPATDDPHNDPRWQVAYTLLALCASVTVTTVVTVCVELPILEWGRRIARKEKRPGRCP